MKGAGYQETETNTTAPLASDAKLQKLNGNVYRGRKSPIVDTSFKTK